METWSWIPSWGPGAPPSPPSSPDATTWATTPIRPTSPSPRLGSPRPSEGRYWRWSRDGTVARSCYYLRSGNYVSPRPEGAGHLMATTDLDLGRYKLGWSDKVDYIYEPKKGLSEDVVRQISEIKGEPEWMMKFRLRALKIFERKPMAPWFAVNMPQLDFQNIYYYLKPTSGQVDEWEALPESMKATYEKLGIPEAERKYLAGVTAQYESEVVYHKNREDLAALPGSRITYTTIQNWSPNVYNLVTRRARAEAEAHVEWIDGNIGSRLTMKYPSVYLVGPKATGEVLSVAYAGPGQHQDAGAKMIHAAPETSSTIVSKSISKDGGRTSYRGLVKVEDGSYGVKSHVRCDALILDEDSRSDTYPYMEIEEQDARIGHEATVSKVGEDQLFYLMARGLTEQQATAMIVNGFIEPVVKTLPMEYAIELSRLIELSMEGAVG